MIVMCILQTTAFAAPDSYYGYEVPIDVSINGSIIKCPQKAFVDSGTTYIPLRAFSDALGGTTNWNNSSKSATVTVKNKSFVFYSSQNYCTVNGTNYYNASAKLHKNTMFVPVKFICEHLGFSVNWDSYYYVAEINAPGLWVSESCKDYSYTEDDLLWLAKIVQVESGGEGISTRIGVANAVINRMHSPSYPNTIKGVIMDTKHGTQFPPAHTDKINVTPSATSMIAAKCAFNGVNLVGNAISFVNVNSFANSWVAKNLKHVVSIGNLGFFAN